MARKKKQSKLGRFGLVLGITGAGYLGWRYAESKGWLDFTKPEEGGGGGDGGSGGGGDNGGGSGSTFFDELLTWLEAWKDPGDGVDGSNGGEDASTSGGLDLSGASDVLGTALKAAIPIWLGTSKTAGELVHTINVAIPGDNTGIERGNKTLFTASGPFVVRPGQGCYNLAGQPITCPASDEIIGIEQHTLDWYKDELGL